MDYQKIIRLGGLILNVLILTITFLNINVFVGDKSAIFFIVVPALVVALLSLDSWLIWVNILMGAWSVFIGVSAMLCEKHVILAAFYIITGVVLFFLPILHQYFKE